MRTTLTPSGPTSPSAPNAPGRSLSPETMHPIFLALAGFVVVAALGLGIALFTGATVVFNILVFVLFTVLWCAFVAALVVAPRTLDDIWHIVRALPLIVQGVVWLLFLPLMIGLWMWERSWALPVRLVLVLALAALNVFMFVPRSP